MIKDNNQKGKHIIIAIKALTAVLMILNFVWLWCIVSVFRQFEGIANNNKKIEYLLACALIAEIFSMIKSKILN